MPHITSPDLSARGCTSTTRRRGSPTIRNGRGGRIFFARLRSDKMRGYNREFLGLCRSFEPVLYDVAHVVMGGGLTTHPTPPCRRFRATGGTFFFTVALSERGSDALTRNIDILRGAYMATVRDRPVHCDAMVVLPDHLHAIWTLPDDDTDYSTRWRLLKSRFSHWIPDEGVPTFSQKRKAEVGLWQRRFWEHRIRNQTDFDAHLAYCWGNPVRHRLVARAIDWPYSTFHRDVAKGVVDPDWSCRVGYKPTACAMVGL